MKRLFLVITAIAMLFSVSANATTAKSTTTILSVKGWEKAKDGIWAGKDGIWYKLDDKAMLWWSKDGKKWESSKDQTWQDKDGKWIKIGDKKLWWSADGKKWAEVPEWKWQASNGTWYKFDKDWFVWENKM